MISNKLVVNDIPLRAKLFDSYIPIFIHQTYKREFSVPLNIE